MDEATGAHSWPTVLTSLVRGSDLDASATAWAMEEIFSGSATPAQIAGFAIALRAKGETVEEVEGLVATMYAHAESVDLDGRCVDIVGTGGDMAKTVNISSMSAVALAGTGATVVKHGGRAASSASGAADVLEALGVRLDLPAGRIADVARAAGITFCFAPVFHSSMRFSAVPRRELGIPTVFNFLGPLTNPARPAAIAVGVADSRMAPIVAGVLARRGTDAMVFRGDDGLDELTTTTTSTVWVVSNGTVTEQKLDPRDVGIELSTADALRGGDPAYNARVFREVLDGQPGAARDAVVLNASAGLAVYDAAEGDLVERLRVAGARVRESLDSGAAARTLARWVETTDRIAAESGTS